MAGEGLEDAGDGVRQHQDEGHHPGGGDDLGGVGFGLPRPGGQRVADGAVALQGDGHQVERGHAHGDACEGHTADMFTPDSSKDDRHGDQIHRQLFLLFEGIV